MIVSFSFVCACEKDFDLHSPDVNQFVQMLKNGTYREKVGYDLPDFKMADIDQLLVYAKDTSVIEFFPIAPEASHFTGKFILNECFFWTIDGIRYQKKYLSFGPGLRDTSMSPDHYDGYPRLSGETLLEISDLYIEWFKEYKTNPSELLRKKNIFENTTYCW
jgi:hypothetical protein